MLLLLRSNFLFGFILLSLAKTSSLETTSTTPRTDIVNTNSQSDLDSYPCPNPCNCFYQPNPDRVDVACSVPMLDIRYVDFSAFNSTDYPSRIFFHCPDSFLRSQLDDGIFESLHAFYYVKIENCLLTKVSKYAFRGMNSLKTIIIMGGLASLETLNIEFDINTEFDKECFQLPELSNLEEVSLTDTDSLAAPSMCNLDNLWLVNISRNRIETFADTGLMCDNLTNIEVIDISGNRLVDLPLRFDSVSKNLKRLTASRNRIRSISPVIFDNIRDIQILELDNNKINHFPPDFLGNSNGIQTLQLAYNYVGALPDGLLSKLENLTFLNLDGMGLDDEVWGSLVNLKCLQVLYLNDNLRIKALNISTMHELNRLAVLEISRNLISEISNGTFEAQKEMILLNMTENMLTSLDKYSLKGLEHLISLDLRHNQIVHIHYDALFQLTALQLLNLSHNYIQELPHLPSSLIAVDLRHNEISKLEQNSLTGLYNLLGLNLMYNRLTHLPPNLFMTNVNLRLLQLAHNNLVAVDSDSFAISSQIETLILDHNNISDVALSFRSDVFPHLKTLDLSNNRISRLIPPVLGELFSKSVEEIFLSRNEISILANYIFKLPNLRVVDLRLNKISSLSNLVLEVSQSVSTPVVYYLSGNNFDCDCKLDWLKKTVTMQSDLSDARYLIRDFNALFCQQLYPHGSGLLKNIPVNNFLCTYEENCFGRCSGDCCSLENCPCRAFCPANCTCYRSNDWVSDIIDCVDAQLSSIPENTPPGVTEFYLSGNNFPFLTAGEFAGLDRLQELYLDHCNISVIDDGAFQGLENLGTIDLGYNFLHSLDPNMFIGLSNLRKLTVSFNSISYIPERTFDSLKILNYLDLTGNYLNTLSQHDLTKLSLVSSLKLSMNPWSCECTYLRRMKNFTIANAHKILDFSNVVCVQHNSTSNISTEYPLADVNLPDFCQNDTVIYNQTNTEKEILSKSAIAAMSTILSIMVLGLILFGLIFWNREFLKVWCFIKFGWKFNGDENKDEENRPYDAFVSYSSLDEEFVVRELVPYLEEGREGRLGYRLCVHYRDFAVGASIAESIISAVELSRRVIIILSNNFLSSEWCQYEFQTAHHQLLEEKKSRIIMILLHDINLDMDDHQLKDYIKTRTYLKYGDPWFWEKLEYVMPKVAQAVAENTAMPQPDVIPNINIVREESPRDDHVDGDMQYIFDNMKNFEADEPKLFSFEVDKDRQNVLYVTAETCIENLYQKHRITLCIVHPKIGLINMKRRNQIIENTLQSKAIIV